MHLFVLLFVYKHLLSKILYKCLYKSKYIKELQFCQSASKIKCLQRELNFLVIQEFNSTQKSKLSGLINPNANGFLALIIFWFNFLSYMTLNSHSGDHCMDINYFDPN